MPSLLAHKRKLHNYTKFCKSKNFFVIALRLFHVPFSEGASLCSHLEGTFITKVNYSFLKNETGFFNLLGFSGSKEYLCYTHVQILGLCFSFAHIFDNLIKEM